jgi:hypothetical protein
VPTVELNVKFVKPEIRIWRLYPGERRNLYDIFLETGTVFLDLPSLRLDYDSLRDRRRLNAQIARARDMREWHRAPEDDKPAFPQNIETSLDLYGSRSTGQQYGNIYHLYFDAQVGDLVLVPVDAGFQSYLMIGEISAQFDPQDHQRIPIYGNDAVPFRRVRWINPKQLKRVLSPRLAGEMAGRRAIRLLGAELEDAERERLYVEVFEVSYRDFIYKKFCEYVFDAPEYVQKPMDIFPGAQLLSASLAYANMIYDGDHRSTRAMSISEASFSGFADEGVEVFEVDFSSPGFYRIKIHSRTAVLLAVAAMTACLSADLSHTELSTIRIENAEPLPIDMTEATRILVDQVVAEIGLEKVRDLSHLQQQARAKIGFRTKARAYR